MINLYMKNKYANLDIMIRFIKRHDLLKQDIKKITNISRINKNICLYTLPKTDICLYNPPKTDIYQYTPPNK